MLARAPPFLLRRFRQDQSGVFVILMALLLPVLFGAVGLGIEVTLWLSKHRDLQGAADSSAVSAATGYYSTKDASGVEVQAAAVAASYGYTHGVNDVALTVNRPPLSGKYVGKQTAVEVIVREPQARVLSALWATDDQLISARAVAFGTGGLGCVIALNPTVKDAVKTQGSAEVALAGCSLYDNSAYAGCALSAGGASSITALSVGVVGGVCGESNITTTDGVHTGVDPAADPYADRTFDLAGAGPCIGKSSGNKFGKGTHALTPGRYCNGFSVNSGANVTLAPGVYYMDRGSFSINGGASLSGDGVTIVYTSSTGSDYASATVNGGATVAITAPTSGPTAGIAFFGDRNMPEGTKFSFNGGATQEIGGAIYLPRGDIRFAGGASTTGGCTQLVGSTVTFTGNSNFELDCSGSGINPIGAQTAKLVE